MSTNTKRILVAIAMIMSIIGFGVKAKALQYPHDKTNNVITTCNDCHVRTSPGFKSISSFNNLCFNSLGCHRTGGKASKKQISMKDASDRFRNLSALQSGLSEKKHSSHGWKIPNANSNAGVINSPKWTESARIAGLSSGTKIYCSRCHATMGAANPKFLRADPTGNYICMQCHSARRIDNVRAPLESSALHYSHPVEVNYSTAHGKKPDFFETTPQLASVFGYKTSASVRLYTTHNTAAAPYEGSSRLAGSNKGAVVCQSCHGPIHSADSNPYTFDNLSAWSRGVANYSSSAGNLLRMYPIAGPRASDNLCKSCHKVKVHETNYPGLPANYFSCGRCHTPHKKAGEANRYLILENISTPFNGIRPVYFVSTSAMAKRYGAGTENSSTNKSLLGGYSTSASRLNKDRTASSAICQVCHTRTKYQRNYSSRYNTRRGGTGTGHDLVYNDGTGKFRFCPECHMHTSAFKPAGAAACGSCHVAPPYDTYSGGASTRVVGRHAKHVKYKNGDNTSASYSWDGGTLMDDRSADAYGFSCGRCHSPYANYSDSQHKPSNFDDAVYSIRTADVGFNIAANAALPKNPFATPYQYQNRGVGDWGANNLGSKWSTPDTGGYGQCNNLYCHGQFYNGYTSNNPKFTGTQPCGSCHGAKRSDPPGKTNGVNYGAHPRHVGNANNQQYNSSGWKFGCSACHYPTVQASMTSIDDRSTHVDGRLTIEFNGGGYGNANSTYGAFADYTSRKPAFSNPLSNSRPAYKTCGLIYCHSDGSRTQGNYSVPFNAGIGSGTGKFPNWSSSSTPNGSFTTFGGTNTKRRCYRCHGNSTYKGITAAMPGYTSLRSGPGGKGNSHKKHVIVNGFMCNVCHSETVNADNKSIASTTKHVNQTWDIKILRSYSGIYDPNTHTCSMVSCHARKTTPVWGNAAICQNCHLSNTGDTDKRIRSNNTFQSFSETAAKIYSTQWADTGHGRTSGTYGSGNTGANKVCTDCHLATVKHGTSTNPFRLYTAPGRPNRICEGCHGTNPWVGGGSTKTGIQAHASSVVQTGKHNFAIKCIDCHDPHGDNNSRFMTHSTVARPRITGTRAESSNQYGQLLSNITGRNVDFVGNQYTSDYAKKVARPKICQVCHTRTKDQTASDPKPSRFRWYSASDKAHGSTKCTSCHTHASGFKGAGCDGCHGFPPTGTFNLLSGSGRVIQPANKQRPSGNSGSETASFGAHQKHFGNFSNAYNSSKATICSFCHQGGMYATGSPSYDIEIGFKPFPDYTGSTQKYTGQAAVRNGFYGYSGIGMNYDGNMRCTVKCHGGDNWLSNNLGNYTTPKWNVPSTVRCGKCHGAKKASGQGSWPTSNRHAKHAGTSGTGYDFMCRVCHADTVMNTATTLNRTNHVNGQATFRFYTGTDTGNRVWSGSAYNGGDTKVNSGFGRCENLYCHSRGTTTSPAYDTPSAYPNYTAKWDASNLPASATEKCSYCHGSKQSAGGYAGITSAMPNQSNQAHKKHVVDNGFKCYFCHSATVDSSNAIVSTANHVNKFKNISIISTYRTGQTMYSSSLSSTNKTCKNIRCHAGRKTPNWTVSYGTINCPDCHYSNTSDTDNFAWTNFSGNNIVAAKIYSTEWTKRGHGKSKSSGKYPFSNNTGAQKSCTNCHKPAVKHGDANYFRLYTSNSDSLCMSCHGRGSQQLNAWGQGYSDITGIQSHTWNNVSTNGYNGGSNKANANGGWNFTPKCVDCHDPHGDKNNYMIHSYINMSGSDSLGRPTATQPMDTNLMNFTAVGGPQMNWSSYVRSDFKGICQRCHSDMTAQNNAMINFNKATYSSHNKGKRCTDCHKHKKGFAPAGCDSCHDYPPPKAPAGQGWPGTADDMSNMSSLHIPHAWNKRQRPGIPLENDVDSAGGKPANEKGYYCYRCHAGSTNGQSVDHGTDYPAKQNATMANLTMLNGAVRAGKWSPGALAGGVSVTDDTCWNVACHTPRYYTRQWKKPTDCDDCHGYRNKSETAAQAFKIQTSGSHKIHVNYSTPGIAGTDFKKYGLLCSNCHYDWQGLNNYSTHYSSYVNITANGPVNTIANMKVKDGQFYTKGRLFEGYTTGNETFGTCAKAYCHGNFTNGTTATLPNWKKGVSPVTCGSCHKAKTAKVTGWTNGTTMPEAHPKHVRTAQYNFPCARCHSWTVTNNTTIQFAYSSHVNGEKNVIFNTDLNNNGGNFNFATARKCKNTYCHSSGYRSSPAGSFTTRTTLGRYTASWNDYGANRNTKTGNRPCSYCHGNNIYAGVTAAMPNQTSLWGNSHRTHVIRNNFRCVNCHAATVNAAGQIATYGNHVNGFKNISIISTYKSGQTLYSTSATATMKMTCKNVKCHAGKTTPKWGTYATCQNCHLSNTGDTDKRISANNKFQDYTAKTGATAPRIYSTAWANQGHGKASGNYGSGNQAANKTCTSCHKASVSHGTAGNPFRLYTINSVTGNPNTLCNDCHGANPGTPANKIGILTHASSVTQTGRHNFAIKCIDCHDPHGDNNTRFMVHSTVVRPRITGTRAEISNANGSIFLNATGRNVDFTQNLYSSDYAKKVTAAKICQVCHTRTFKPNSSMTRFRWNGSNDNSHGTGKCVNCHSHSQGFKGMACNACHGFPPTSATNLIGRPGTNQVRAMSGSTTAGAHQRHVNIFGSSNDTCNKCHSGGMAFDSNENDDITLKFDAFNLYTGVNQDYRGQTNVATGYYGYSGTGAGAANNTYRCESVKCHGGGGWLTKSFGSPTAPKWNDTTRSTVFCGSCHGAKKASNQGTWPTTNAHKFHAGTSIRQQDLMCKVCHDATIQNTATTLNYANHINGQANVSFGTTEPRADGSSAYTDPNGATNNSVVGKCTSVYCHSRGTDRVAPYDAAGSYANFTAIWNDSRGGYKKANGQKAKCNYCHGNTMSGVTSAMPIYDEGVKANKHPKHVRDYNFLCNSCHNSVVANNTSIQGANYALHVNRSYNVNFNDAPGGRQIENAQNFAKYTSIGSRCESTYCHSRGTDLLVPFSRITTLANYTAKWGDSRGGINFAGMAKCNYCHGVKGSGGSANAAPAYANSTPKANRHPMHVTTYGFTCTVCHTKVTTNNTSIDASGARDLHMNKSYNINFSKTAPFAGNTGTYAYQNGTPGSKCKNTYCHSRGTDSVAPYNTRTSFANWTARWGDTRNGYRPAAIGQKAKCNYCHGNRVFGGVTAAMPNYSTEKAKDNTHPIHVRAYGFTCTICHVKVTSNNTSIDAAGGTGLHVNKAYNVNFKANVRGYLTNNTGIYNNLSSKSKCKNTYCHSRGTDFTKPYNTRTSFANWTARWGDARGNGGYKQAQGLKAKCNYCHGNRAYSGMTSAMPNYSGTSTTGVTAKANSHRVHVVGNGFVCSTCHYGVVRNNTSISDRTSHVNGFYNISITPAKKSSAGKAYSTNWTDRKAGGTCMRNACHGSSTPQWGNPSTANCKACHFTNADNDQWAVVNDTPAGIYSSEWKKKGHGKFDAFTSKTLNRCERCHKASVSHNYAQSPLSNPFRLYTLQSDALCSNCHGVSTERNKSQWGGWVSNQYTGILTHSKANTGNGSVAAWNTHSSVTGKGAKCVDCHDPHGDKNRKMIHAYINHSGSDKYGRPAGPPWSSLDANNKAQMTFTSHGAGQQLIWSSFINNDVNKSICRRCHTPGDPGLAVNQSKNNYDAGHQLHTDKCTASCHRHKTGFKPTGESSGGQTCTTCHQTLFDNMRNQNNYHHVMMNTSAFGGTTYRNVTLFGPSDAKNPARRCLMCHVDHDVFSPKNNALGVRAKNLRVSARVAGNASDTNTFINTDFWPAKRKNSVRTGEDFGTGNYSSAMPIPGPAAYNGVCISCHKNVQYKNTTLANDAIKTSRARSFSVALYTSSSHNFQVISGAFRFGDDNSSFRGNCTKCHRTPMDMNGYGDLNKGGAQDGRYAVALHDKNNPSLLMGNITSSSRPKIERLCFNCHDTAARSSGGPGSMDYYSSIRMNSGAKMIKTAVVGKKFVKPIEDDSMAGRHKIDEFWKAPTSLAETVDASAPFWNFSTTRHIECVDCHNTHGGNANISRTPGGPYRGTDRVSGSPTWQNFPDGNLIAGAQKGVWGVSITYSFPDLTKRGKSPAFTQIAQVTYQYEVCLKCHSTYAYGPNPRGVPSGVPDPAGSAAGVVYDNLDPTAKQADISKMINPNNFGYHPIYKKGRNQPPKTANTDVWPAARSNWMYKNRFTNKTAFISVSGLSWNFVPPFSQHSLLACTDCHVADNSGQALGRLDWSGGAITTSGTWNGTATGANIAAFGDAKYAVSASSGAYIEVPVSYKESYPVNPPDSVLVVAYGRATDSGKANRDETHAMYSSATQIGTGGTVRWGLGDSRWEKDLALSGQTWARLNRSKKARITVDAVTTPVYIDYLGIEAVYQTTADVRGPHGSMERWLLTDVDRDIQYDAGSDATPGAPDGNLGSVVDKPHSATYFDTVTARRIFCLNCHRYDVYDGGCDSDNCAPQAAWARYSHPAEGSSRVKNETYNVWGIWCMNCHAGGGTGEIHGTWANRTTPTTFQGTRINLSRPRGVRLFNGALAIYDVTSGATTCYTQNKFSPFGNGCNQHGAPGATGLAPNYTYTSW